MLGTALPLPAPVPSTARVSRTIATTAAMTSRVSRVVVIREIDRRLATDRFRPIPDEKEEPHT